MTSARPPRPPRLVNLRASHTAYAVTTPPVGSAAGGGASQPDVLPCSKKNTDPRTNPGKGGGIITAILGGARPASPPSARHSAAVAGAACRILLRHLRFHSFLASRLSRAS